MDNSKFYTNRKKISLTSEVCVRHSRLSITLRSCQIICLIMIMSILGINRAYGLCASSLAKDEAVKEAALVEFKKQVMVQKLVSQNPKVKAEVTTLETFGQNPEDSCSYQAVVQLGMQMPNGSISYAHFTHFLKVFNLAFEGENPIVNDVTELDFPKEKMWAHYKISTGTMDVSKNPKALVSALVKGTQIYYVASEKSLSDVFIPVESIDLFESFRILLLNSDAASMFWIQPSGKIVLAQTMTEESDGPLGFGLTGGGKTGWSPWNHQFMGMVQNVEEGNLEKIIDVNQKLMPPRPFAN